MTSLILDFNTGSVTKRRTLLIRRMEKLEEKIPLNASRMQDACRTSRPIDEGSLLEATEQLGEAQEEDV